jgi:hypothetical protein
LDLSVLLMGKNWYIDQLKRPYGLLLGSSFQKYKRK